MRTTCSLFLAIGMAAGVSASIDYSLEEVDVFGTGLTTIGSLETGAAGMQLESIDLSDAQLVTYDNTGIPNFADEVLLGLELADSSGASVLYYFFPFSGENSWGDFGPLDLTIDLLGEDLYVPESGVLTAFTASIWNDGSDESAGLWTGGIMTINLIPAPGAVAILLGAAIATTRRRRA
ncbi:MAG: hypothetical protein P8K80_09435 [Phycisphaerales bacterium]|nr:hypothetical protein [Phycisphaerales bacterium]